MEPEFRDVRDFHKKFDLIIRKKPTLPPFEESWDRYQFMKEELEEFMIAFTNRDFPGMTDALIDIVYVAKGTAVMMGLPWKELWADVQRANMGKIRLTQERTSDPPQSGHLVISTERDKYHVYVTKPEGWIPPRTADIVGEVVDDSHSER